MAETKVICDTDVDTRQSRHNLTKRILEEKIGLDNMMLSAISRMELMAGATTKRELVTLNKKLARFDTDSYRPCNYRALPITAANI